MLEDERIREEHELVWSPYEAIRIPPIKGARVSDREMGGRQYLIKSESTEFSKSVWADVDKAAARIPAWARAHVTIAVSGFWKKERAI